MSPRLFLLLLFINAMPAAKGQDDDLLKGLAPAQVGADKVMNAFKSSRVILSHSTEMQPRGVLDFRILHRFGNANLGIKEFFGLDQATIRLGLDYGITSNLAVGIGRGSYRKELDGFVKYRLLQQSRGAAALPLSVVLVGGTTLMGAPWPQPNVQYRFGHRLSYFAQLLAGRKFSEAFTLQFMPTWLHQNLVPVKEDRNNLFAAGVGGRVKISKRSSFNFDYYYVAGRNKARGLHNPLSMGFDIETGGHVFQLHFTNAIGMNERVFLAETTNSWRAGDIQFGFNISRAFQISKRTSKPKAY